MNTVVQRLVALLKDPRPERRCAAAMVLGEVGGGEKSVLSALADGLKEENRVLRLYVLESLENLGAADVADRVVPLIEASDEEVRRKALGLLERQGARIASALARELPSAPLARRRAIVSVLARNRSPVSLQALLDTLRDPDVAEHTLVSLRAAMDEASAAEHRALLSRITAAVRGKAIRTDAFALSNVLRLLGYVGDAASVPLLMGFLQGKQPVAVRVAGIAALRRPLHGLKRADKVATRLLELAGHPDVHVSRAAIDTLRAVPQTDRAAGPLIKLCDSPNAEVRAFAAERLGTLDTEPAARHLVELMLRGEPVARDAAARSLSRLTSAVGPLLAELTSTDDAAGLRAVAMAVVPHARRVGPAARRKIADRAAKLLEKDAADPRATALMDLLSTIDTPLFVKTVTERASRLKRATRMGEAAGLLRMLARGDGLDDEARYLIGTVGLAQGARELARAARSTDPFLSQFSALLSREFPLVARLKKDAALTPEHLYYLGFNFVESPEDDEREFGADVLRMVASRSPGSKVGKIAKNKLRLAGLES
jgi:HEAT repeat protein